MLISMFYDCRDSYIQMKVNMRINRHAADRAARAADKAGKTILFKDNFINFIIRITVIKTDNKKYLDVTLPIYKIFGMQERPFRNIYEFISTFDTNFEI